MRKQTKPFIGPVSLGPYQFYDLPDEEQAKLVGWMIPVTERPPEFPQHMFILRLSDDCFNYGRRHGIVFVAFNPKLTVDPRAKIKSWVRVGVISPDDLDMDLDFDPADQAKYLEVLEVVKQAPKDNVDYAEFLDFVRSFCGGVRTS